MGAIRQPPLVFQEEQRFERLPYYVMLVPLVIAAILLILALLARSGTEMWGATLFRRPLFIVVMAAMVVGLVASGLVLRVSRMTTEVRTDGLYVQLFPSQLSPRRIPIEKLKKLETTMYRPFRDYGGWGIRGNHFGERAYIIRGNRGVKLHFVEGAPNLIGSQRPEELAEAITGLKKRSI